MKILYSQIKELVPELKAPAQEVAEVLTMIGFMCDDFEQVDYKDKRDFLISLEVRQNRADCLSVIGVAREVAAYYRLQFELPKLAVANHSYTEDKLNINIKADKYVRRVVAVQIVDLKNAESPTWLKELLIFHDINPINLLVDISNYVMLYTGYTSHLLDINKMSGGLVWQINKDKVKIKTLDDTEVELSGDELVIKDDQNILALAGIVGCQTAAIDKSSKNIIVEMAVYERSLIMKNSRSLGIVTEASNRLSKDLDPDGIDLAFDMLIDMLLSYGQGELASAQYNYYLHPHKTTVIDFDSKLVSAVAGIDISNEKVVEILENLRFKIERLVEGGLKVTVPSDRLDVTMAEDLVEEVIRIVRYDSIPKDELPEQEMTVDITPKIYLLKERIRDSLTALGYDEVLSQPLVGVDINQQTNWQNWQSITTQNSVNEEYPDLRQSMASGLLSQLQVYIKKNLSYIQIFEIGRVFGQQDGYQEHDALGLLWHDVTTEPKINQFRLVLEQVLRQLGLSDITYQEPDKLPQISNPYACWQINVLGRQIGVIYKMQPQVENQTTYFTEINLELIMEMLESIQTFTTVEIIKKIVALDANTELDSKDNVGEYLQRVKNDIGDDKLWSLEVTDIYKVDESKIRYTIRASYQNLSDQEAKELHLKVFNLK